MHSKIINPKIHGKAVYENKGSSALLVAYLQHEGKEKGEPTPFFNEEEQEILPEEVQQRIDYNVKGLRKSESKFIALVLSPGPEELKHIENDPEKLKAFTVKAMEHYAGSFHLKDGKSPGSEDLLWFATIHHHRTFKGTDAEVKEGLKKSGEQKAGLNMHVHVVVSKRDRAQKVTLSPFGNRDRFNMNTWQRKNQETFNRMFDYRQEQGKGFAGKKDQSVSPEKLARMQLRISAKVETINLYLDQPHRLKLEEVLKVAEKREYGKTFFYNLNRLELKLKNFRYVRDPMHLLEHNRDVKPSLERVNQSLTHEVKRMAGASLRMGFTEQVSLQEFLPKKRRRNKDYDRE